MNTYTVKNILNYTRITLTQNNKITQEYDILPEELWMHEILLEDAGYTNADILTEDALYC